MDALRRSVLDLGICQKHNFGEDEEDGRTAEPTSFNIISVFALEDGTVDVDRGRIVAMSEQDLRNRLPEGKDDKLDLPPLSQTEQWHQRLVDTKLLAPKPQGTTATLNVMYVHNEVDSVAGMSLDTLLRLFTVFGFDPSFLHFLNRTTDSWHCVRHDEICAFLFIIQSLYCMVCSFFPNGPETNCLIFGRPPKEIKECLNETNFNFYQPGWFCEQPIVDDERPDDQSTLNKAKTFEPYYALPKLVEKIESHHLHHPLSLAYLGLVDSLSSVFVLVDNQVVPIHEMEDAIEDLNSDDEKPLESLVNLFEKAGRSNLVMAKLPKITGVASMLLHTLQDRAGWKRWCRRFCATTPGSLYDRAAVWLDEGLVSCRQILQNEKLQIQSQDDRVKALTPIVFALISRADAQSGLTIAVMTMAFLPATSIAAIMAVPWDRGGQATRNLQGIVYCVVTVCMTLSVFLIWIRGVTWFKKGAELFKSDEAWFRSDETWFRKGAARLFLLWMRAATWFRRTAAWFKWDVKSLKRNQIWSRRAERRARSGNV